MEWQGMICLVTGASSGFGYETAKALARRGATVIGAARREQKLQELVKELGGEPHSYVICDVSDLEQVRMMRERLEDRCEYIDILVNNAGRPSGGPLKTSSSEGMEEIIRTNLLGPMWCTKELLPLLESAPRTARTPVIVNVASMAGRLPVPKSADYAASKFGLVGFTESVWLDLNELGIKAMMVNPGAADTEGFPMDDVRANPLTAWTVMGPDRVANAVIRGVERGAHEVRVQWWLHLVYHASVTMGPLRRYAASLLRGQFRGEW
jgi:short-subunit dehydrogenase